MKIKLVAATGTILVAMIGTVAAESSRDAPITKATEIHHTPGNTPGFGGSSANPNGNGRNGGGGVHNIGGGAPGQGGSVSPGEKGGPSGDMHGGLDNATGRFND
ncbi:MAG: hypothetical protein GKR97_19860 [Rhizobiaceae bacterium]|nr:hypothetical protein [Rhizobiaceae bacterium]